MTLRASQECACRMIDEKRRDSSRKKRPLVLLTSEKSVSDVQKMVSVSMPPGSECFGSVWRAPDGEVVSVRGYEENVPPFAEGFDVAVCNGGADYSSNELKHLERWRKAASNS